MDQPNRTEANIESRSSNARESEPVCLEPKNPLLSQTRMGLCCLCGPGLALVLLFVLFPLSSYVIRVLMDSHILPSGSDVLGLIGLTVLWPPLVLLLFIGIPVGIVILNKARK